MLSVTQQVATPLAESAVYDCLVLALVSYQIQMNLSKKLVGYR